jgi:hypothetical protein
MHKTSVTDPVTGQEIAFARVNLRRDQILARLWELANLPPEATKGSIAGQIKAMAMIVAIEGLLPDRHQTKSARPAAPPATPNIYVSEAMRRRQTPGSQTDTVPGESVTTAEAEPTPPPVPNDPVDPLAKKLSRAPNASGPNLDTHNTPTAPPRLSLGQAMERLRRGR